MAETIVSFAVERLRDLLISEAKFLYGVSDQVEEIKAELRRMQCLLQDADAKQGGDSRVRNWVREIRQLAHQTEDVLEIYALQVSSKRGGDFKKMLKRFACIFREGKALHKVGVEIMAIKSKLTGITNSLQTYGIKALEKGESNSNMISLRISYSHLLEKDFVGMEKDVKKVVTHLKSGKDECCQVVSIWGMGGLGKTTLATKIYNHIDVQTHFKAFAWVCVTQKFEKDKVVGSIFKQLVPGRKDEVSGMEDADVREVYRILKEKSCLVVVDDIWSLAAWKRLRPAFPIGEVGGSKILLTTRIQKVAGVGIVHELHPLDDGEGLELLLKKAFPLKNSTPGTWTVPQLLVYNNGGSPVVAE